MMFVKFRYFLIAFFVCLPISLMAQDDSNDDTESDSIEVVLDSTDFVLNKDSLDGDGMPITFGKNLDGLLSVFHSSVLTSDCVSDSILPVLSDTQYMERLQKIPAIMELVYNPIVKSYIELYTVKKRKQMEYMLGVGAYYFPIFEQALDAAGLPIELKYLPVIESALNPKAYSVAGASGLWQFMYGTGKVYGLVGNSLIDERRDPIKATNAAVRYLRDLHNIYNDWSLVIAAYNCGPGNVNKAIRRAGGKRDYWAIYPYLPRETRGYVPAFIGATYAMTYYKEHGICPAKIEMPMVCDTVMLNERLHLSQVAEVLGVDLSVLQSLNPQYRKDIIPGNGTPYSLCLPQGHVDGFITLKDSILKHKADSFNVNRVVVIPAQGDPYYRAGKGAIGKGVYVVKKGDTLSGIAKRRKVSVATIKKWNNLKSDRIYIGQRLKMK
jgi:membrane-bound lytic murein transglycosylase D